MAHIEYHESIGDCLYSICFFSELLAQNGEPLVKKCLGVGSIELSTGLGYCVGDAFASPFSKSVLDGTNYDFSIGFRHIVLKNIGYRIKLQCGNYASDDGIDKHHSVGLYRSKTNLVELSLRGEYIVQLGSKSQCQNRSSIYFFLGGGGIMGKVSYPDEAYKGFFDFNAGVLMFGLGYACNLNKYFSVGIELATQYSLTDKVDGYPLTIKPNTAISYDVMNNIAFTFGCRIF